MSAYVSYVYRVIVILVGIDSTGRICTEVMNVCKVVFVPTQQRVKCSPYSSDKWTRVTEHRVTENRAAVDNLLV